MGGHVDALQQTSKEDDTGSGKQTTRHGTSSRPGGLPATSIIVGIRSLEVEGGGEAAGGHPAPKSEPEGKRSGQKSTA